MLEMKTLCFNEKCVRQYLKQSYDLREARDGLTWSYQSRVLIIWFWWSATLSIVVLGEWWRSLIGKDIRVEGRGSEDGKYRRFFQGVLPQKQAKMEYWPGTESGNKNC